MVLSFCYCTRTELQSAVLVATLCAAAFEQCKPFMFLYVHSHSLSCCDAFHGAQSFVNLHIFTTKSVAQENVTRVSTLTDNSVLNGAAT